MTVGQTYAATDTAGRAVVLKRLDRDCLLKGQLHPNIKDRLARVRELALTGVATLYGVERDGESGEAYLVWQFVDGVALGDYLDDPRRTDRAIVLREVAIAVEALHGLGLVHGAIHGRNVFVVDSVRGTVRLTHVSPLLHHDVGRDEAAVRGLLSSAAARSDPNSPLARLAGEIERTRPSLRTLITRLTTLIETGDAGPAPETARSPRMRLRVGSIVAALVMALVGVGFILYLKHKLVRPVPAPLEPPVLKTGGTGEQRH